MAVDDLYQVTVVCGVNGQRVVNVMHFREGLDCTDDVPARSICAAYEDVALPLLTACLAPEAAVECIYARRIAPTPGIPFLIVETSSPGELGTECVPSNAAAVISLYTSLASRSGRGRQYISGVPEDYVADGVMEAPLVTALEAYAQALIDGIAAPAPYDGAWVLCIYSPLLDDSNDVEFKVVSPSMGSMRSRRQPHGMVS